jgi:chondroitin 4-sulfotransferase 11
MINDEYKCIFIAIPRTATRTVRETFKLKNEWHCQTSEYSDSEFDNFFKFSFARNPWDRLVSVFFHQHGHTVDRDFNQYKNNVTFLDFVKNLTFDESLPRRIFDEQKQCIVPQFMLFSQLYWLNGKVDFIGKFENLQEDFNTICDKIGIPRQKLPHEHKTEHKHYTEYYDEEIKQIVAEKYTTDIEYFGYKFGE